MDPTERQMSKIVRELAHFTAQNCRQDGLGATDMDLIHTVRHHAGCSQAELCRTLCMDRATVARRCAVLETKGYLTRKEDAADKRCCKLYATERAESMKLSRVQAESLFYEWLTAELGAKERAAFTSTLDKLYRRSKQESRAGFPTLTDLIANKRGQEDHAD